MTEKSGCTLISYVILFLNMCLVPHSAAFDLQILADVLLIADNKEQHVLCWNNSRIGCWTRAALPLCCIFTLPPVQLLVTLVSLSRLGAAAQ